MSAINLDHYRQTGEVAPAPQVTASYAEGCAIRAEIELLDDLIESYELRIHDLRKRLSGALTAMGGNMIIAAIEADLLALANFRNHRYALALEVGAAS